MFSVHTASDVVQQVSPQNICLTLATKHSEQEYGRSSPISRTATGSVLWTFINSRGCYSQSFSCCVIWTKQSYCHAQLPT